MGYLSSISLSLHKIDESISEEADFSKHPSGTFFRTSSVGVNSHPLMIIFLEMAKGIYQEPNKVGNECVYVCVSIRPT